MPTFHSYPLVVQHEVQHMNNILDSFEKRKYVSNQARFNLSTQRSQHSEAYACLIKSLGLNATIQDEFTQKLVAWFEHSRTVYYNGNTMLDDFITNNGTLPHRFSSYK